MEPALKEPLKPVLGKDRWIRRIMAGLLMLLIGGMLLLEYGESIILGALVLMAYAGYLYLVPLGRRRLLDGIQGVPRDAAALALIFIVGWSFLSTLWSRARVDTLGNSLLYLTALMIYLALAVDFYSDRWRRAFLGVFALAMAGVLGKLVWQYGGAWRRGEAPGREIYLSTIENSNNLGLLSLMFFLVVLGLALGSRRSVGRILGLGIAVLALFGMLTSRSRASLVVSGLILICVLWKYRPRWIVLLIPVGLVLVFTPPLQQRVLDIFSYEQNVQRVKVWLAALWMVRDNPLTGIGANAFRVEYVRIFQANPQLFNQYDIPVLWHAHNMYLRFASELGLPGLASSLVLTVSALRRIRAINALTRDRWRWPLEGIGLAILAFFLANLLDSYWALPKPIFVFCFLLGITGGFARDRSISGALPVETGTAKPAPPSSSNLTE